MGGGGRAGHFQVGGDGQGCVQVLNEWVGRGSGAQCGSEAGFLKENVTVCV